MPVMSLNYDLFKEPGRVYKELIAAIEALPDWCHPLESSWLVVADMTPEELRAYLHPHLHARDKVLIFTVRTPTDWASRNMPDDVIRWLHKYFKTQPD